MTAIAPTRAFAFYDRVSTDDAQDPSLSIPRQLAACRRALEPGRGDIVARFWDIETMLAAVPDLRSELGRYEPPELAELLDAFDLTATYDKPNQRLELAATVTPELATAIAGAGFEPATSGL